jgi:hypothetical protein
MIGPKRCLYWLAAIAAYWFFALWLLYRAFPVFVDSGGAVASFHWGRYPLAVGLTAYQRSIAARLMFLYPYWIAASLMTSVGCGLAAWAVRHWRRSRSRAFLVSSAATLFSLLLAAGLSDAGTSLHVWRGPTMYGGVACALPFLRVMAPVSLLAGALAVARDPLSG